MITAIERELIDASQEIGGICESAAWYTDGLAREIESLGKPIGDYTISELLALDRKHRDLANATIGSTKY